MATKKAQAAKDRAERLRLRYGAKFCVCGRPKGMREPFCKKDMQVLGEAGSAAPRPLLKGDLDDAGTAAAWETCLAILQQKGWVKAEVAL